MDTCADCGKPIFDGEAGWARSDPYGKRYHAACGDPFGLKAKDAEIERLKHDIERHIAICGTQEQDIERLQQRVAELYRSQKNDHLSLQANGETIARLTRERDAAIAALRRIADGGLAGAVETAREALALEQTTHD